jgi:hypothetical protein
MLAKTQTLLRTRISPGEHGVPGAPSRLLRPALGQYGANLRATGYWESKLGNKQNKIDWAATGNAVKRSRSQWLTKHLSGFCSVGSFAKKIGLPYRT